MAVKKNARKSRTTKKAKQTKIQSFIAKSYTKPLIYALVFAIIGGGYYLYKSLAASPVVLNYRQIDGSQSVNATVVPETVSQSKRNSNVIELSNLSSNNNGKVVFSTVGFTLDSGIYKVCAFGRAVSSSVQGAFAVNAYSSGSIGPGLALQSFSANAATEYGSLTCASITYTNAAHNTDLAITVLNQTTGGVLRISSILFTKTADIPPPPSNGNPSGQAMPVGDIPGWHQVFTDDFTSNVPIGSFPNAVSNKWWDYPDGWTDTSGNGTYMPSRVVSQHDGVMDLFLHTENGTHMVAAPVALLPNRSSVNGVKYARYVVRFKSDVLPGYKTAWLLWPDQDPPNCNGETDFPEASLDGRDTISAFAHFQNARSCSDQNGFSTNTIEAGSGWHTAITEWTANGITFSLDGQSIGTTTQSLPINSMHWVLQTETSLNGSAPPNSTAGHVQIDWVAVYRPQ